MEITMCDMTPLTEANKVKEIIVTALVKEGYLTEEKGDEFLKDYAITLRAKGWFGQLIDKLRGEAPPNHTIYNVVKIVY